MRFDEKRQISRLVETFVAQSNAAQRRGRAGRVRVGVAFNLFTKHRHDTYVSALSRSLASSETDRFFPLNRWRNTLNLK